jgi:hypothetical protein
MNKDNELREHILNLLNGGMAYSTFDEIVKDFPKEHINSIFPNGDYSFWQLLEHIRITQYITLYFMTSKNYVEPKWPDEYWPDAKIKATENDWLKSVTSFKKDMKKIVKLLMNKKTDLYSKVSNGTGQTFMREFLLIADHNSYHLGELSIMRQVLNTWGRNREI